MLAVIVVLQIASSAQAVEWTILSPTEPIDTPARFTVLTVDIALSNNSGDMVQTFVGELTGLAAAGVTVIGGQSASSHFVDFCFPLECFGGIATSDNAFFNSNDLAANGAYTPGDDRITIVNALRFGTTTSAGSLDPGLDGAIDQPSMRDVTLSLLFAGTNPFLLSNLMLEGFYSDGVNLIPISPVQVFTVTPEPGTALLLGIGLVGLSARMRSRHR